MATSWLQIRVCLLQVLCLLYGCQKNEASSRFVICSIQVTSMQPGPASFTGSAIGDTNNTTTTGRCSNQVRMPSVLVQDKCNSDVNSSTTTSLIGCLYQPACLLIKICIRNCSQEQTIHDPAVASPCIEPSIITMVQATFKLLQDGFNWKRALSLVDNLQYLTIVGNNSKEISVVSVQRNYFRRISATLKASTHKITTVLYIDKDIAVKILCEAYKQELFYSAGYAWVIVGVDVDELLNTSTDMLLSVNCTLDMIKTILNYTLIVEPAVTENSTKNCALARVASEIEYFNNGSNINTNELSEKISNITFITKQEESCDNGNGTVAIVFQYRYLQDFELNKQIVAVIEKSCVTKNYSIVFANCENETTIFPDGVPTDGSRVRVLDATHIASFIVSVVLYGALFTFAMGCLLFNLLFRNRRIVKLTSPTLNCVMIAGALFLGLAFVLYTIPIHSTDILPPLCISRISVLVLGHDVCFGIALLKLIRIHHIFRNPSPNKKAIKDWHLLSGLGIILGVEAVLFAILQAIAFTVTIEFGEEVNKENPVTINAMGVIEDHYIIICGNPPPDYAVAAITVMIKFALHVIAIVLAIRTRNIEVEAVNNAKETQAIVYISTAVIILVVVCNFTLEGYANAYGLAIGILSYSDCVTFLGLTFIPKMVILAKDPSGDNVFKTTNLTSSSIVQHGGTTTVPLSANSSATQTVHLSSTPDGTIDSAE